MLRKLGLFSFLRQIRLTGVFGALCLLAGAPSAFATRIVYFEVLGHSSITEGSLGLGYYNPANGSDTGPSTLQNKCRVTVTNSGSTDQKVSVDLKGVSTGNLDYLGTDPSSAPVAGSGSMTYSASSGGLTISTPVTDYVLSPNSQLVVEAGFPQPHYLTVSEQDIRCSGNISATDDDVAAPGFLVASGMMSTWSQSTAPRASTGGSGQMRAQVRYFYTPFTIGGGRAF